jgi:hypothetical protein
MPTNSLKVLKLPEHMKEKLEQIPKGSDDGV